jgi:hypothetical protein
MAGRQSRGGGGENSPVHEVARSPRGGRAADDDDSGVAQTIVRDFLPRLKTAVLSLAKAESNDSGEFDAGLDEVVGMLKDMPRGRRVQGVIELALGLCELEKRCRRDRDALAKETEKGRRAREDAARLSDKMKETERVTSLPQSDVLKLQSEMLALIQEVKKLKARNASLQDSLAESLDMLEEARCAISPLVFLDGCDRWRSGNPYLDMPASPILGTAKMRTLPLRPNS